MASTVVSRLHTKQPTACAVCRRRACWLGFAPVDKHLTPRGPVLWLCKHPYCHGAGKAIYYMSNSRFDEIEQAAALEAGAEAARYLESCGTTDLAHLRDDEWREFLRRVVSGFGTAMRRKVIDAQAAQVAK
jgi:hypothetical protein